MSAPPRTRRHDGGKQPHRNIQRADFLTLVPGLKNVFVVWREGARMPQSFHHTEEEAIAQASQRCQPGQRAHILHAELIGSVESSAPVTSYSARSATP